MNIKLIPTGKGSRFTFPALPEKVQGKYGAKYRSYDIISQGTIKVPKGTDVAEFTWNGVFFGESKKNEPIVQKNHWKKPNECVKILTDFMQNETVLNLIVTETWINVDVTISSFQPSPVGAFGNIEYSITFVQKKTLKIYTTSELKIVSSSKNTKKTKARNDSSGSSSSNDSYTVVTGDTLSTIAQSKCGGANKWQELYNENKTVIEETAKKRGLSNSDHGQWIFPGTVLTLV